MEPSSDGGIIVTGILALAISVMLHEAMHAWSADKMGDPTGRLDGRISLNPFRHIDPFFTIIMPILTLVTMGIPFGGAKPVRINALNFRNPALGMMVSAAAGPLTNFALAALTLILLAALSAFAPGSLFHGDALTYNGCFFRSFLTANVLLGVFNMIPIPPLDGSRVLRYLLPPRVRPAIDAIEHIGLLIILAFVVFDLFGPIFRPLAAAMHGAVRLAAGPLLADLFFPRVLVRIS